MKKTNLMRHVEKAEGGQIEEILLGLLRENSQQVVAERLGVSRAALGYWMLKCGIKTQIIYLAPGESFKIVKNEG